MNDHFAYLFLKYSIRTILFLLCVSSCSIFQSKALLRFFDSFLSWESIVLKMPYSAHFVPLSLSESVYKSLFGFLSVEVVEVVRIDFSIN